MLIRFISMLVAGSCLVFCASTSEYDPKYFRPLKNSLERIQNPGIFFAKEFEKIKERRRLLNVAVANPSAAGQKPKRLIGLAFSGGGIRSNAINLGILAGLYEARDDANRPLLHYVDYISSVSGGSWASLGYITWSGNGKVFFDCLTKKAAHSANEDWNDCPVAPMLANKYKPFRFHTKGWRKFAREKFLHGRDWKLNWFYLTSSMVLRRPYPIINSTHSIWLREGGSKSNMRFEITPHRLGPVSDCGSFEGQKAVLATYCKTRFFQKKKKAFSYSWQENGEEFQFQAKSSWRQFQLQENFTLSHAIAASSAVAGFALGINVDFKKKHPDYIRSDYRLTDGGKSDNTGMLGLMERKTDLIIASDVGQDQGPETQKDLDNPRFAKWKDFRLMQHHAQSLHHLGVDDSFLRSGRAVNNSSYYPRGEKEQKIGDIIYFKPIKADIKEALEAEINELKRADLQIHMKKTKTLAGFPHDPTLSNRYHPHQIALYYHLGRSIARDRLSKKIKSWLEQHKEQEKSAEQ